MRKTGLARGQGMKLAISSAPKARKVFVSHPRAGRRALLGVQASHLPCAKWSFWWVSFREQTWVTSRERRRYAKREASGFAQDGIGSSERQFLAESDSFYTASVGATGWPYVQHRGGPKGFLKVIDEHTVAFADFRGNKQFISTGN